MAKLPWISLCTLLAVVACSDPAAPNNDKRIIDMAGDLAEPGLRIEVMPDTVYVTRTSNYWGKSLQFDLRLTISNYTSQDMVLGQCGGSLQRKEGDEWRPAWLPYCAFVLMLPDILEAGYQREEPFPVYGSLSENAGPKWEGFPVAGQYRVAYTVWRQKTNTPVPDSVFQVYSSEFTLVDAPE